MGIRVILTGFFILTSPAIAAEKALCISKFTGKFEPADLTVKQPPTYQKASKLEKIYIQKGKYIYSENELSRKKGESYCSMEYTVYPSKPYSKIWGKNAVHHLRANLGMGDELEPETYLGPRAQTEWVAITYRCPYITTHQQLKDELKPLIDAPCTDWGDLLPGGKLNPDCDK